MKFFTLILMLVIYSCAQTQTKNWNFEEQIASQEARNLKDVQSNLKDILQHHPELSEEKKRIIAQKIEELIQRQKELRAREEKILQLLLNNSLKADTSQNPQLTIEMERLYKEKASVISSTLKEVKAVIHDIKVDDTFYHEFPSFLNHIR